jgi:hypothetical protein
LVVLPELPEPLVLGELGLGDVLLPELPLVLGELVLGEELLLPEVPPALEPLLLGEELPLAPVLPVLPLAPLLLPLVTPSSFRHFSRSAPTMPRHLLLVLPEELLLPDALGVELLLLLGVELLPEDPEEPPEALSEELLPDALGVELLPLELGLELLPDALGVLELPPEADEPLEALSDELLPLALGVELLPLLMPLEDEEPELCAIATLDSAKSAAAVAALISLRVIGCCSLLGFGRSATTAGAHAAAAARRSAARRAAGAAARRRSAAAGRRCAAAAGRRRRAARRAARAGLEVSIPFLPRDLPVVVLVHRREARGGAGAAGRAAAG